MKIVVPKNWHIIRKGILQVSWQHGRRKCVCEPGKQPRYIGWVWTSECRISLYYEESKDKWIARIIRPYHPVVTIGSYDTILEALTAIRDSMATYDCAYHKANNSDITEE